MGSDPDFSPNKMDKTFNIWASKGLCKFGQMFGDKEMKSFEQLSLQYDLPKSHLFRFFQVRSYLFDVLKKKSIQEINPMIKYILRIYDHGVETKILTHLVKLIQSNHQDRQTDLNIKNRWENEILDNISSVDWEQVCKNIHETTNSNYWKEFAWKIVNRYFRTPQIQSKYKGNLTASCWRKCGEQMAHHGHIFWSCAVICDFWENSVKELSNIFGLSFDKNPLVLVLGKLPEKMKKKDRTLTCS